VDAGVAARDGLGVDLVVGRVAAAEGEHLGRLEEDRLPRDGQERVDDGEVAGVDDVLLVGLAGPAANFCIFVIAGLVMKSMNGGLPADNYLMVFLSQLVIINFVLMLFNLIPIPPLDGSKVLFGLLPPRFESVERTLEIYGPFILLGILFIEYTGFPFIGYAIHVSFAFFARLFGFPF
jgi:Zn-dependent protease